MKTYSVPCLILCISTKNVLVTADNHDDADTILARPTLFELTDGGTFTCVDPGSRCVYEGTEYTTVDKANGQNTRNAEWDGVTRDTWSALKPATDYLSLGACQLNGLYPCYVNCNAKCDCTTPTGQPCDTSVTRAPTTPPPTPAPVASICPRQQNTNLCRDLMPRVPINNFFDCYNFCGGVFFSSCAFQGQCGPLECGNATATGLESVVLGCTDADRVDGTGSGGGTNTRNDGSTAAGTTLRMWIGTVLTGLVVVMVYE